MKRQHQPGSAALLGRRRGDVNVARESFVDGRFPSRILAALMELREGRHFPPVHRVDVGFPRAVRHKALAAINDSVPKERCRLVHREGMGHLLSAALRQHHGQEGESRAEVSESAAKVQLPFLPRDPRTHHRQKRRSREEQGKERPHSDEKRRRDTEEKRGQDRPLRDRRLRRTIAPQDADPHDGGDGYSHGQGGADIKIRIHSGGRPYKLGQEGHGHTQKDDHRGEDKEQRP